MATNLGEKNSTQRQWLWDKVIHPLNNAAKAQGLSAVFGRNSWLDAKATGSGNRTAKWKQVRELAKSLSELLGLSFNMATSMSDAAKAQKVVERIRLEIKSQKGADAVEAADAAGDSEVAVDTTLPTTPVEGTTPSTVTDWTGTGTPSTIPGTADPGVLPPVTVEDDGLSTGAKVGIGVGAAAVLIGIGLGVRALRRA